MNGANDVTQMMWLIDMHDFKIEFIHVFLCVENIQPELKMSASFYNFKVTQFVDMCINTLLSVHDDCWDKTIGLKRLLE